MENQDSPQNVPVPAVTPESATPPPPAERNVPMGILAYIGPLVIVSYIVAKDDPFVKYHIRQGLALFCVEVAAWFLQMVAMFLWPVIFIANIATIVLMIVGIVNVVQGKEKELPLIGQFGKHFNF